MAAVFGGRLEASVVWGLGSVSQWSCAPVVWHFERTKFFCVSRVLLNLFSAPDCPPAQSCTRFVARTTSAVIYEALLRPGTDAFKRWYCEGEV